jgi:OOP family OmpA-OmpF porin
MTGIYKMNKIIISTGWLSLVGYAVLTSSLAAAEEAAWYGGLNIGQSKATIDDRRIGNSLSGFTSNSISDANHDSSYKLFGGLKFDKYYALEAGYFNLGEFGFTATTVPAGRLQGATKIEGINLDAVLIVPLNDKLSALGRAGFTYAHTKDNFTSSGAAPVPGNLSPGKYSTNPKLGIGLQYAFTQNLGLRAEAERYRVDDAIGNKGDVDLLSVGLVYHFNVKKSVPVKSSKSPEPSLFAVAQSPVPIPAIVKAIAAPMPVPAVSRLIVFSVDSTVDSLFDFDKATLKPSGELALDKFAADLKGSSYEVITITGHADRIGSEAYNMTLSTERAAAVETYLIASGISPDKIKAKGVGVADPVTAVDDCKGKTSDSLIACLEPDRRVDVEVTATRSVDELEVSRIRWPN